MGSAMDSKKLEALAVAAEQGSFTRAQISWATPSQA